jgi:hypothetical protein
MNAFSRIRSAVSGRFASKAEADANPRETVKETNRDRPLLIALWEAAFDEHDGSCKICDSFPHPDGTVSHGEDCPIPLLAKRLGK